MQVYEYYLLGNSVKTVNRKYKCYIDKINDLYDELNYNVGVISHNAMDKFEFLANYVIIYMSAAMCLDALVHDNIIDITDKILYLSRFEKFYGIVK